MTSSQEGLRESPSEPNDELFMKAYAELRKLAAARLSRESDETLDPTGLVHEAYMRLAGLESAHQFEDHRQVFMAAAEAMRRILIDRARKKKSQKRGGEWSRVDLADASWTYRTSPEDLLALDEALEALSKECEQSSRLVQLRFFAGLSLEQAAEVVGVSRATAYRNWTFAKAWLYRRIHHSESN